MTQPARKPRPPMPIGRKRAGLTDKQSAFCREYLKDYNRSRAARAAGYAPANAEDQGSQLLRNPHVQAEIARLQARIAQRNDVTVDRIVQEFAKVGFANVQNYITITHDGHAALDLTDVTPEQFAAIGQIDIEEDPKGRGDDQRIVRRIKLKLHDKLGALTKLGEHIGMFNRKLTATDAEGNVIATFFEEVAGRSVVDIARLGRAGAQDIEQEAPEDAEED